MEMMGHIASLMVLCMTFVLQLMFKMLCMAILHDSAMIIAMLFADKRA